MKHSFTWQGEPIQDIAAWATARGERMVPFRATRDRPSLTGDWFHEEYDGEMPESFWNTLHIDGDWRFTERKG